MIPKTTRKIDRVINSYLKQSTLLDINVTSICFLLMQLYTAFSLLLKAMLEVT